MPRLRNLRSMSYNSGFEAERGSAGLGQRSIVRELLLEAAIDDIFEILADQSSLDEKARLHPLLVESAKRTAIQMMSGPTREETAEFWSVYAKLILAVAQPAQ